MLHFKKFRESNCICMKIKGGLGNQMFQYAAGLATSRRLNSELVLELPEFGSDNHKAFGLDIFDIDLNCFKLSVGISNPVKRALSNFQFSKKEIYRVNYVKDSMKVNEWKGSFYVQPEFAYDPNFKDIKSPCLMEGYFQSEMFFQEVEDEVRQAFNLSRYHKSISKDLLSDCSRANSVAVHIRRGDYANNPEITAWHGLIDKSYYDQAKKILEEISQNRNYIIFSDDPIEARAITSDWENTRIVEGTTREIDLLAMTLCQDHIIANSTFSWWGAWLNSKSNKHVLSPKSWLMDELSNKLVIENLIPKDWILL